MHRDYVLEVALLSRFITTVEEVNPIVVNLDSTSWSQEQPAQFTEDNQDAGDEENHLEPPFEAIDGMSLWI